MLTHVIIVVSIMKRSELLKLLRKNGIVLFSHGANHDLYRDPKTNKIIAVPRHAKELPTGTASRILKDAGIKGEKNEQVRLSCGASERG